MRSLLKKNLMAHKATNKLTSVIYALTLGCIIFLCVSLNLLLKTVSNYGSIPGSDITMKSAFNDAEILPSMIDPTLKVYSDSIQDWSYVTENANELSYGYGDYYSGDIGKQFTRHTFINGVSPSAFLDS